jgi:hypothetical protein
VAPVGDEEKLETTTDVQGDKATPPPGPQPESKPTRKSRKDAGKPRGPRRRPQDEEEELDLDIGAEAWGEIIGSIFEARANDLERPHWKLTEKQRAAWGKAVDRIMKKYDKDIGKYGPEIALGLLVISDVGGRFAVDRRIKRAKQKQEQQEGKPDGIQETESKPA